MASRNAVFRDVDLQCLVNNRAHHTEEMSMDQLVVRRGQHFFVLLRCKDAPPQPPDHQLTLVLKLGSKGEVVVKVSGSRAAYGKWWFSQQAAQREVLLRVHSPADAPVGQYTMTVLLLSAEGHILEQSSGHSFFLLFNPWNQVDSVYLPDEELLQEYVLNENGILYQGSWNEITSLPWNFGQFEKGVVDICFEVLDNSPAALKNSEMDVTKRSDPVYISRIITAMASGHSFKDEDIQILDREERWFEREAIFVKRERPSLNQVNSNDDRGVLFGRWDGQYGDGVAPTRWTGSIPILRRWSERGSQQVRYGQCWVFCAVACTILRCLGIPTRCVTNYSSAHDTNGNISVDYLFNEKLERVSEGRKDTIWNYHCWVESWMRREDLPKGYDGWQVLDPTPQERSDGVYCCGPCPVQAVKEGEVGMKYDAAFVFSEVNADLVCWIVHQDGEKTQVSLDSRMVGRNISTKSVYGDYREDITDNYKHPEGSRMERVVYEKAGKHIGKENDWPGQLKLFIRHAQAIHGTDFDVIVEVQNVGREDTPAQLTVKSNAVTYNSIHQGECQKKIAKLTIPAQKSHREIMRLRYDHYGACVSEHHLIRVTALLQASSEHKIILQEVNIPLKMPKLQIKIFGEAMVSRKLTVLISFTNPLPVGLKRGVFTVEGAGLTAAQEIQTHGDIGPGQDVAVKFSFKPMRAGLKKLLVDFDSDRLRDVKGEATLIVQKKQSENA